MAHKPTPVNDSSAGADTPTLRSSHAQPPGRTELMEKVTQPPRGRSAARHSRAVTPAASPRLIEEAVRIFLALGVTAEDLHLWARPGSAFVQVADAMDTRAGTS
jgi:hypothetical protein